MNYTPEHNNAIYQINDVLRDIKKLQECGFQDTAITNILLIAELRKLNKQIDNLSDSRR